MVIETSIQEHADSTEGISGCYLAKMTKKQKKTMWPLLTSPAQRAGSVAQLSAHTQHLGSVQATGDQAREDKLGGLFAQLSAGLLSAVGVVESQQVAAQVTSSSIPVHPQSIRLVSTANSQRRHSGRD